MNITRSCNAAVSSSLVRAASMLSLAFAIAVPSVAFADEVAVRGTLRYRYTERPIWAGRPTDQGRPELLAEDPLVHVDGGTVTGVSVVNSMTLQLQPAVPSDRVNRCWRVDLDPNTRAYDDIKLLSEDPNPSALPWRDFRDPGSVQVPFVVFREIHHDVRLRVREFHDACPADDGTTPIPPTYINVVTVPTSNGSGSRMSELKGFPINLSPYLRLACDLDQTTYSQAGDGGILAPRTLHSCELAFDPWNGRDYVSRSQLSAGALAERVLGTQVTQVTQSASVARDTDTGITEIQQLLQLAGPQVATVTQQLGDAAPTSREWRIETQQIVRARRVLERTQLPRLPISFPGASDTTELIVTATTTRGSQGAQAPSTPIFRVAVRPTGTTYLGLRNAYGSGVRAFATVAVIPFAVRAPASASELRNSSDAPGVQIVAPRVGVNLVVEPWSYRNRRHLWATYFPVRLVAGFTLFQVSERVFAPSSVLGAGISLPIAASESASALSASISFNVFWEHEFRENGGNHLLITSSFDLLSLLSPQSAASRPSAATGSN